MVEKYQGISVFAGVGERSREGHELLDGHARIRRAGAHGAGLWPDERAAGRPLAGAADGADHRRVFPRPEASERAAADGQRLPFRAGRRRSLQPARAAAVARRLPADAGERGRRLAGAHRLGGGRVRHRDPGGLCAGRRFHRSGGHRHFQPYGQHHHAVAPAGRRGFLSGGRSARLVVGAARSAGGRRGPLPRRRTRARNAGAVQGPAGHYRPARGRGAGRSRPADRQAGAPAATFSQPALRRSPRPLPARPAAVSRFPTRLEGCRAILDGETDDWAESSLYMVGTLEDARRKEAKAKAEAPA